MAGWLSHFCILQKSFSIGALSRPWDNIFNYLFWKQCLLFFCINVLFCFHFIINFNLINSNISFFFKKIIHISELFTVWIFLSNNLVWIILIHKFPKSCYFLYNKKENIHIKYIFTSKLWKSNIMILLSVAEIVHEHDSLFP